MVLAGISTLDRLQLLKAEVPSAKISMQRLFLSMYLSEINLFGSPCFQSGDLDNALLESLNPACSIIRSVLAHQDAGGQKCL